MSDSFREGVKSALAENPNIFNQGHSQEAAAPEKEVVDEKPVVEGSDSSEEGNTSAKAPAIQTKAETKKEAVLANYEIGGRKFKDWEEVKKWGDNASQLYGNQIERLKKAEARAAELEKGEVAQLVKSWKDHPKLQERLMNQHREYMKELEGGATKAEAAKESGLPTNLPPEIMKKLEKIDQLSQFQEQLIKNAETQREYSKIQSERDELKKLYPDISDEMMLATLKLADQYAYGENPMTLKRAHAIIASEMAAPTPTKGGKTGDVGKTATVKGTPKKLDLSDPKQARKNLAETLGY